MNRILKSGHLFPAVLAVGLVLLAGNPLWACTDKAGDKFFDWQSCWSGLRFAMVAFFALLAWGVCFFLVFPQTLSPEKSKCAVPA